MSANNAFHIAVLSGDGIGPEVMAPALEVLRKIEKTTDLTFRFTEAPAGANHYRETGRIRRVGKGALAPCPPSFFPSAQEMVGTRKGALPTLRLLLCMGLFSIF